MRPDIHLLHRAETIFPHGSLSSGPGRRLSLGETAGLETVLWCITAFAAGTVRLLRGTAGRSIISIRHGQPGQAAA